MATTPTPPIPGILKAIHANRLPASLCRMQCSDVDQVGQVSTTEARCAACNGDEVNTRGVWDGLRLLQAGSGADVVAVVAVVVVVVVVVVMVVCEALKIKH
jgi:hypothetical protein